MAKCITTYNGTEKNGNVMVTIMNYLLNKGLLINQVAGIMGNIAVESSGYKTEAIGDRGTSIGICQWHDSRKDALMKSAKANNKDWRDLVFQLDFLWSELNSPYYKKVVLDWFKSNPNASVKDCTIRWERKFEVCDPKRCDRDSRLKHAQDAVEFYNKYASGECSSAIYPSSITENNSNVNGEGNGGSNIGTGSNGGTEVDNTDTQNPCNINVNVINQTANNSSTDGDSLNDTDNNNENVEITSNTTDYKGKTLQLRLEREDFNCVRTIGKLYDTTDGKKQFICYIIEDRVRYGPDGKCCKAKYTEGKDRNGNWLNGPNSSTAIPYGKYKIVLKEHRSAKSPNDHYGYGYYHKNTKYRSYIAGFASTIGKTGACRFRGVLIHASPDTNRGDQNNSGGCLVTGLKNNGSYLSQTIEAFHLLYDNYLIPATAAGSNIYIDIPRLYASKDNKCYLSTNDMGQLIVGNDKLILDECSRYMK